MDNKDFSDIGEQIRKTVEGALGSQNFEQLNKNISDSVSGALDEVKKSLLNAGEAGKKAFEYKKDSLDQSYSRHQPVDSDKLYRDNDIFDSITKDILTRRAEPESKKSTGRADGNKLPDSVRVNYPGKVSGILYTVFGSIGIGVTALVALILSFISILVKPVFGYAPFGAAFFLVLGCIFSVMLGVGKTRLGKIWRLKKYLKEAGNKTYCPVEQLAAAVGKPQKFVVKDVERLISGGILPEARLDEKKTCLMLDKATYNQYLDTQNSFAQRKRIEAEEAAKKLAKADSETDTATGELKKMITAGKEYLRILREANDAIPGENISAKLSKLEAVIGKIFETVEKHPEQMGEMERFMDYYLPTTVKLVNAYRDFDRVDTAGGNVESAKQEIENTLDTINHAFESLLDNLYADAALDASTDATVLQTMLKRDGFAGSDFK